MRLHSKHTTLGQLSRYVDGTLEDSRRRSVEAHLRECHRCRGEVAFMREIGQAARNASHPRPPSDLLDRIQASRASGHRVILPADTLSVPPQRRATALVPVVLLVATGLTLGALGLLSPDARAGASTLALEFERDEAAPRTVQVEYRGAYGLAGEMELKLRGRYRTASHFAHSDDPGTPIEGLLSRERSGVHRGSVALPPTAVYAIFAVEDLSGEILDTNVGRFWEILATDENGFPLYEALRQKFDALESLDWVGAYETAVQMTELYPERAEGWWHRFSYKRELASGPALEDLIASHHERLASLEQASLAESLPDAQQLGALVEYARVLDDRDAVGRLSTRLEEVHPAHGAAVRRRIGRIYSRLGGQPSLLLEALEQEWQRTGPVSMLLVDAGYETARRLRRPEAVVTWADRLLHVRPSEAGAVAVQMLEIGGLRAEAMRRLRRELHRLDQGADADRDLTRSAEQHRRAVARERAELLASLGEALAAERLLDAAVDTLRLAVSDVWDPDLYRRVAHVALSLGDRSDAIELYARVAADPLTPPALVDSLRTAFGSDDSAARWDALVARNERSLEKRLTGDPELRDVPPNLRLTDLDGRPVSLPERTGEGPAVLAYWTLRSPPDPATIDELESARRRLADLGVPFFLVVRQPSTSHLARTLKEDGSALSVLLDPRSQLLGEFDTWLDRQHLVLDERGLLHLHHESLEDAVRHAVLEARRGS